MVKLADIKYKKNISKKRFCPPHYIPHKLPLGEKIADEPCHIHKKTLGMIHHRFFCRHLNCPNYDFMIKRYKKEKDV